MFATISLEYNGAPGGPVYVVRRHGGEYVAWHRSRADAVSDIARRGWRLAG